MPTVALPFANKAFKPLPALLILTLVFGSLDILDALLFWGFSMDVSPLDVFQGIASGVLGSSAFHGGAAAAALGALIHYAGFFCLLGLYHLAVTRQPLLGGKPLAYGLGYGLVSYFVVHYLILPMTAFHIVPGFYLAGFTNAVLAQTVFVGLPSALLAGGWAMREKPETSEAHGIGQATPSR
ncbi:MAG TPA: hypothetical protein VGT99_01340 [Gammaproteobacteria bacterium]|nr:hypothetical protein [Gammaproteobacteria bacterium]